MTLSRDGLVKREPVVVHAVVLWLLSNVGALVVEKWHWMGAADWSDLTKALIPVVSFAAAALAGWLLRRVVSPAWKSIEDRYPALSTGIEDLTGVDVDKVLAEAQAEFAMPEPEPAEPTAT